MRLKLFLAIVLFCSAGLSARADGITFTLSSPVQNGLPGQTLSFYATVTAPSTNSGTVYFNGYSIFANGFIGLDPTAFFHGFPLSLGPNQSYTGLLFTVSVPSSGSGTFDGGYSLLGGSDGRAYSDLGDQTFSGSFGPQVASTPEPASLALLATGTLAVVAAVSRRREKQHSRC